jgi:hypothetical protein
VDLAPGDLVPASLQPDAKADSEIFNKFGRVSEVAGVPCVTDFVSDGFLALVAAGLLLLFSILLAIAAI